MDARKYSFWKTITSIVASTLGAGITSMPSVVYMVGPWGMFGVMGCVTIFAVLSLYFLSVSAKIYLAEGETDLSYEGIAAYYYPFLRKVVVILILFSTLSTIFTFIQRIMDIILVLYSKVHFLKHLNPMWTRIPTLGVICFGLYFLFRKTDLAVLSPFQYVSFYGAIFFAIIMLVYACTNPDARSLLNYTPEKFNIAGAIGCCIFALHCQTGFIDIFKKTEDVTFHTMRKVCLLSGLIAGLLYSGVAYLGFIGIGSGIGHLSVLKLFATHGSRAFLDLEKRVFLRWIPYAINIIFCVILSTGIAFNMFIAMRIGDQFIPRKMDTNVPIISRKTLAIFGSMLVFVFGLVEFDVDWLISLFGYIFISPLSFILPSMFVWWSYRRLKPIKIIAFILGVVSTVLMVVLFSYTIYQGKNPRPLITA